MLTPLPLVFLLALAPADETAAARAIAAAKKEFEEKADALLDRRKQAKTPAEKEKVAGEIDDLRAGYLARLVRLAETYPATEATFDLLVELVEVEGGPAKRARELIAAHHTTKPWVKDGLPALAHGDDPAAGAAVLAAVAKNNPDRTCRGLAQLFLGISHKRQAADAPAGRQKAHLAAAEAALTAARDEYADVRVGPGVKVGKAAASALAGLKNLPHLAVGGVAPDIAGEDLDGKPMKLSDFRGKVVLLDFWASNCGPCLRLVPHARRLGDRYKGRPFAVVGVNADDDVLDRDTAVRRHGITWRSFQNAAGDGPAITDQWNVEAFPTVYLLDHAGVVRKVWEGFPDVDRLEREVAALVAAAEKK